jgi:hypothetical protein
MLPRDARKCRRSEREGIRIMIEVLLLRRHMSHGDVVAHPATALQARAFAETNDRPRLVNEPALSAGKVVSCSSIVSTHAGRRLAEWSARQTRWLASAAAVYGAR